MLRKIKEAEVSFRDSKPEIQNIPVRTESVNALRLAWEQERKKVKIDSDYAALELRFLQRFVNKESDDV
jgi:DNA polymerase I-like protein with 3'-5' exonuclease and polymerase domains